MRVMILALTLCLAGCGGYTFQPPGANNAPSATSDKALDAQIDRVRDKRIEEWRALGTKIADDPSTLDNRVKVWRDATEKVRPQCRDIIRQNATLSTFDQDRLVRNKISEQWQKMVDELTK